MGSGGQVVEPMGGDGFSAALVFASFADSILME
jgi:hypothetical protein